MTSENQLSNKYVREYYDAQVGVLTSYTDDRWHSSPLREFEYQQTKRALEKALTGADYTNAVEIGPGDGVWTGLIKEHVSGSLHLVEQSQEMLARAKGRFSEVSGISFEHADFLLSDPPRDNDLVIAIRCFEYFEDKEAALIKMKNLLAPGGTLIIVTKNAQLATTTPVQHQTLHSDQLSRNQMTALATRAGFTMRHAYPAVLRWKAAYAPMRLLFNVLHHVGVWSRGALTVPFLTTYATESYVYEMRA